MNSPGDTTHLEVVDELILMLGRGIELGHGDIACEDTDVMESAPILPSYCSMALLPPHHRRYR